MQLWTLRLVQVVWCWWKIPIENSGGNLLMKILTCQGCLMCQTESLTRVHYFFLGGGGRELYPRLLIYVLRLFCFLLCLTKVSELPVLCSVIGRVIMKGRLVFMVKEIFCNLFLWYCVGIWRDWLRDTMKRLVGIASFQAENQTGNQMFSRSSNWCQLVALSHFLLFSNYHETFSMVSLWLSPRMTNTWLPCVRLFKSILYTTYYFLPSGYRWR